MVAGLPDPGEVLELVGGEQAVGPRERATLGGERDQRDHRDDGEGDQRPELDRVEAEAGREARRGAHADRPAEGGGRRRRSPRDTVASGQGAAARRGAPVYRVGVIARRRLRASCSAAPRTPSRPCVSASRLGYWAIVSRRSTRWCLVRGGPAAPAQKARSGRTASSQWREGASRVDPSDRLGAGIGIVEQRGERVGERRRVLGCHGAPDAGGRDEVGERVAAGGDDRQPGPEVVEHTGAEGEPGLQMVVVGGDPEVGVQEVGRPGRRRAPSPG